MFQIQKALHTQIGATLYGYNPMACFACWLAPVVAAAAAATTCWLSSVVLVVKQHPMQS
jgi:hypothetical protein